MEISLPHPSNPPESDTLPGAVNRASSCPHPFLFPGKFFQYYGRQFYVTPKGLIRVILVAVTKRTPAQNTEVSLVSSVNSRWASDYSTGSFRYPVPVHLASLPSPFCMTEAGL
jgi:hypothetical protein